MGVPYQALLGYTPKGAPLTTDMFIERYREMMCRLDPAQRFGSAVIFAEWYAREYVDELATANHARMAAPVIQVVDDVSSVPPRRRRSAHDKHIGNLAMLLEGGEYDLLRKNVVYAKNDSVHKAYDGELDLFGVRLGHDGMHYHYFEMKTSGSDQELRKGTDQIVDWVDYMGKYHGVCRDRLHGAVMYPVNQREFRSKIVL